jgi:hypothetical protein
MRSLSLPLILQQGTLQPTTEMTGIVNVFERLPACL